MQTRWIEVADGGRPGRAPAHDAANGAGERHAGRLGEVDLALATLPSAHVHRFAGDHDIHAQRPAEVADVMLDHLAEGFLA